MKSLKEALIDYDLVQLAAIAELRGVEAPAGRDTETLTAFMEALLAPVSIAIVVNDLADAEQTALRQLLAAGGVLPAPQFFREYGEIRQMGPNRLRREQPWRTPQNPSEGLWYRGLIFRSFRHTTAGPEEIIFIPADLQAALPVDPPRSPTFELSLAPLPKIEYPAGGGLREDLFTYLVYLQTAFVRAGPEAALPPDDRRALKAQWVTVSDPASRAADHWLTFVDHLARRLAMLQRQGRRLKLDPGPTRDWLQQTPWQQLRRLQDTWRGDPTWNDLWHVPTLYPKDTGWENSPMLGRAKILSFLSQVPPGEWVSLAEFSAAIKRTDPDFQRPGSDYQSWYIYDPAGQPLMGFEHWDQVEGALIRHMLETTLHAMGVVDLGGPAESGPPTVFRLTALGAAFLFPDQAAPAPPPEQPPVLRINATDFTVRVPIQADLYDRFQLARFAELVRREEKRLIYRLTRQSYRRAMEQSITLEQILAFLNRATGSRCPLALVEAMRNWNRRQGAVKLERLTVLRVADEGLVDELLNHPQLGPLLDRPLGKQAILVPEQNVKPLRKLLLELGFLAELD